MAGGDAELLLHLSIFAFTRLSVNDQLEKMEDIWNVLFPSFTVEKQLPAEDEEDFRLRTFTELLKKLPFAEQSLFLCSLIKQFKHERQLAELISSFKQLGPEDQQHLIGTIVDTAAEEESNEDCFRLRRYTQLSRDYTDYVYRRFSAWKDAEKLKDTPFNEASPDWQSQFDEFFFGFSIIWFEGQKADGQKELIIQASTIFGVEGVAVTDLNSIRVTRFIDLCKKLALEFSAQACFLEIVDQKIREGASLPRGMFLVPQDSAAAAADLLLDLSTFGFSLLSTDDQEKKIELISYEAEFFAIQRLAEESEEDFRLKAFTWIFSRVSVNTKIEFFKQEFAEKLFSESEEGLDQSRSAEFFLGMSTIWIEFKTRFGNAPRDLISQVLACTAGEWCYIVERFPQEGEEDFKLRRFTETFKQLPISSQVHIAKHIQNTVFRDLGYPLELDGEYRLFEINASLHRRATRPRLDVNVKPGAWLTEYRELGGTLKKTELEQQRQMISASWRNNEFMKVKMPNLKGGSATVQGGGGANTQGGR